MANTRQVFVYKNDTDGYILSTKMLYNNGEPLLATSNSAKFASFITALAAKDSVFNLHEYACVVRYAIAILNEEDDIDDSYVTFEDAIAIIRELDAEIDKMNSADEDGDDDDYEEYDEYDEDEDAYDTDDENSWIESAEDFTHSSYDLNKAETRCIVDALEYIVNENGDDLMTEAEKAFIDHIIDKLS